MNKILVQAQDDITSYIKEIGIVPVIAINDTEKAVPLAEALINAGILCAEITLRTEAAADCIRRMSSVYPEMLLGAGTVLSAEQASIAFDAGAAFVVSPGFNPRVVRYCLENGIFIIPGCSNPSDMEAAMELGLMTVKFFPAEQAGGLEYIRAVSAPYPGLKFMPTGGINAANISKYAANKNVIACGGSWMVSSELIRAGNFAEITRLCAKAAQIVKEAREGSK